MKNHIKKTMGLAVICLLTSIASLPAIAQAENRQQVIDIDRGDTLNVRTGPGREYKDVGDFKRNQAVPVLGYDATGRWAKVLYRGQERWASARYLSGGIGGQNLNPNIGTGGQTYAPGLGPHIVSGVLAVDPRGLALRSGPSTSFPLEQYLGDNVEVFVVSRTRNGNWAFIKFSNGSGYVWTKYLKPIAGRPANNGGQGSGGNQAQNVVPAPDGLPLPDVFTVTNVASSDVLFIRKRPRSRAEIMGSFQPSQTLVVLEYLANGWAKVTKDQDVGYVNADFLTRGGGVQTGNGLQLGLMCRGTEPFWTLRIDEDRTVQFAEINTGNEPMTSLTQSTPSPLTNSYPYNFGASPYTGSISRQACSDGMSDINYGWGITLVKPAQDGGWETLNGCCTLQ